MQMPAMMITITTAVVYHLAVVAAAVIWRHSAHAAKQPKRVTEHENGDAGFQAGGEPVGRCPALLGGAAAIAAVENSRN